MSTLGSGAVITAMKVMVARYSAHAVVTILAKHFIINVVGQERWEIPVMQQSLVALA
jgi:hypothetical protein